jgi:hypothetical protein
MIATSSCADENEPAHWHCHLCPLLYAPDRTAWLRLVLLMVPAEVLAALALAYRLAGFLT